MVIVYAVMKVKPMKYVRIFCDYSADPFWHKEGGMMGIESIPISDALKLAFQAWDQHFQLNDTYLAYYSKSYGGLYLKAFSELGESLAKQFKKELPDWTVTYLNKYKQMEDTRNYFDNNDRLFWEYEITGE